MITVRVPENWRDLQDQVARILTDCGFHAEVEKIVQTARGRVEVDVYAAEEVDGRKYAIACECKHWASRIPQTVVHSFRTVVAESGANIGYIISLEGFQAGAFEAAALTNLRLVTWEEFQEEFESAWVQKYLSPKITAELDPVLTYTEPLLPAWFGQLDLPKRKRLLELKERYGAFGALVMMFTTYPRMIRDARIPQLPVIAWLPQESDLRETVPASILAATGYREFLDEMIRFGNDVISQFRELRPNEPKRGGAA